MYSHTWTAEHVLQAATSLQETIECCSRREDLFTKAQVMNFSPGYVKALSHVIISVIIV